MAIFNLFKRTYPAVKIAEEPKCPFCETREVIKKCRYPMDIIMSPTTYTATEVATEMGISVVDLNFTLGSLGMQSRTKRKEWVPATWLIENELVLGRDRDFFNNGKPMVSHQYRWTEKGKYLLNILHKKRII